MRKLKKESLHAYLHGPLTGTYSRPASHWHLQQASLSLAPTTGQPLTGTYSRPASHWHLQQTSLSLAPTTGQPLTGTYSRPDELIKHHQDKFVTV